MHDANPLDGGTGDPPDRAAAATAVIDGRGVVVGWSPGAERMLGHPSQAVIGLPVDRLLGADAGRGAAVRAVLDDGRTATTLLRHRDGRRMEVRLRAYPWVDGEGRTQHLVVATPLEGPDADPTTEEAAFAQCRLPVIVFDSALRAVRASAGARHELGLSERRITGRRVTDVLPPHVCRHVEDSMRRVLGTGETEQFRVRGRARPAAREGVWAITVSPLRGPDGRVRQLEVSALDVTEQHLARERLTLLNDVSTRIGTTLDVMRTAQEMADLVVGRLADFVTVDLLDSLFRGIEPRPSPTGAVTLRRVAQQSVLPGVPEALARPGDVDDYPPSTPPARCLATGEASLHRTIDPAIRAWQRVDAARSGVLRAFGVHSVMVIPLRARAITLGVALLVRHRREEPFTEDDLVLAEEIGARAAVAVDNARRYTLERETALALQRSLLPRRIAAQEAVEVAHRYLPARTRAGLGGDWYDVIPLSGARVALVVGDVVGHGLRASATMGRLRTVVRTLAEVDLPPDELLTQLDDLATQVVAEEEAVVPRGSQLDVPTGVIASCLYVIYDPVTRRCTAASAGHPPPAVVAPDGTVDFVGIRPGPPLGLGGLPFETREWEVPPGGVLALFTDGLLQGAGHDLGSGLARLRRRLEQPAASLEAMCDDLFRALLPTQPQDDVALLVARTRTFDAGHVATWDLPSDPAAVADARAGVGARLAAWGLEDVAFTAELVVSELVTNAIRYGQPPVQLRLIRGQALICEVYDSSGTSPHLRRARTLDEGGRGLLLVAQFARRWGTRHRAEGKTIWAEIELPGGAA
ncbi:PAS/PAC sensor protein [Streptomyces toyocaensis]|uniref:protein-serine/threonine phosphatase n=1 Tax=Streptomyces toyocaensis TaxID=55952 RepID=A0A081XYB8_STRTO|nr:SpoIIE family protein phosphatase [Streptomyces toyocaensis]KES08541.1 PAS/PAC sensor protein [Streptomyces toyocaensis]